MISDNRAGAAGLRRLLRCLQTLQPLFPVPWQTMRGLQQPLSGQAARSGRPPARAAAAAQAPTAEPARSRGPARLSKPRDDYSLSIREDLAVFSEPADPFQTAWDTSQAASPRSESSRHASTSGRSAPAGSQGRGRAQGQPRPARAQPASRPRSQQPSPSRYAAGAAKRARARREPALPDEQVRLCAATLSTAAADSTACRLAAT